MRLRFLLLAMCLPLLVACAHDDVGTPSCMSSSPPLDIPSPDGFQCSAGAIDVWDGCVTQHLAASCSGSGAPVATTYTDDTFTTDFSFNVCASPGNDAESVRIDVYGANTPQFTYKDADFPTGTSGTATVNQSNWNNPTNGNFVTGVGFFAVGPDVPPTHGVWFSFRLCVNDAGFVGP
jgi:hypothetical protein